MVAGSYSRSLCLYDASGSQPRLLRSLKTKDKTLKGSGVTQVSPLLSLFVHAQRLRSHRPLSMKIFQHYADGTSCRIPPLCHILRSGFIPPRQNSSMPLPGAPTIF